MALKIRPKKPRTQRQRMRIIPKKPRRKTRVRIPAYVAGPLGFSEAGRFWYNGVFLPFLRKHGFDPIDPWVLTDESIIQRAMRLPFGPRQREAWKRADDIIGDNNVRGILRAILVIGILDGTDVDSGTASEIGFAAGMGIPSVGYRGDFRLSADNIGSVVNLQVEKFIRMHGGDIVQSMKALGVLLTKMHKRLVKRHDAGLKALARIRKRVKLAA